MNRIVSIIVPTYNSKKYIKRTIDCLLKQTYQKIELIFVDDCSTDGTFHYLKKLKKKFKKKNIKLFKTKKNSGTVSVPRNLGVKKAKGELICFLDSDDYWEKNKLELQLKDYSNKKTVYSTKAKYFDLNKNESGFFINFLRNILQKFIINKVNKQGFQWFYIYNPIIVSSILAHKDIFKYNYFDEDVNSREDLDMWVRLKEKNIKFFFNKNISVKIFRRQKSMSADFKKELVILVRSLSNIYFKFNNFSKLSYFLFGIIIKFILTFIKLNINYLKLKLKQSILILAVLYGVTFYTPLFWYLGKPLLVKDKISEINSIKNVVVFSGHGDTSYYNMTYQHRYKDILKFSSLSGDLENIFILGRLQDIPEQKIIQKLLIADGFNEKKLRVIYEEFNNTYENILNISKVLKKEGINKIVFITSPYHTKRAKLLWNSGTDIDVKIFESSNWPKKNKFLEYAKNKKIILYEYVSIFYNKILGNI
tara:strand:+ start:1538 stop:2971 length:1434 start_codon:yes stop_codon:yes gene_type:complete